MRRLAGLDTLRGIAALCVAIYHMSAINPGFQPFGGGYLAVDFFFVLSGYVMTRSYEGRGITSPAFLKARIARLWPTMAIGVLLGCIAHAADPMLLPIAAAGLMLVPIFVNAAAFPINNAAWSIFFELLANAIHSAVLARLRTRHLSFLLALLILSAVAIVHRHGGLTPGPDTDGFALGLPRALLAYCLGIILSRRWADRPPVAVPFTVTLALLPVMLTKPLYALVPGGWSDILFVLLVCPILIAGGLRHTTTWGHYLGAISFPLYAVHYPILTLARQMDMPPVAGLGCALAAAALITYFPSARIGRWLHEARRPTLPISD